MSDQGIGISADELRHLFDRFYRAGGAVVSSIGGLGLGLDVCRGLVEAMDGEITIASEVGRGSTVRVRLPIVDGASRAQ